jgi:soluble lytic murein transglycosylase-like protein
MPATAVRFGVTDIFDPRQNIEAGVRYMRWLLDKFDQNLELALAGYNAGEGAVMRYGNMIPPYRETREYVRRISLRYASVTDPTKLYSAKKVSPSAAAFLTRKQSRPLYLYEPSVFVVRTSDGRAMLINH